MKPSKLSDHFKKEQSQTTRIELTFKDIHILDLLPFKPVNLVHLDLSFNSLASLNGIEQFPSLTFLNISNNLIKDLLCLSSIKRKDILTHLQIRGNPASRHPNLVPIIFNYFPNIREIDAEPVNFSIQKDIMQAMELSSSLIPYLYINEQLILEVHRDIQFLILKSELFEVTWKNLPSSVLPNKHEIKAINARFLNKYPEISQKIYEGKIRPVHILELIQVVKEQISINSAHLEEETVCKIYRWLYCEIVLQLHSYGNVDLQCFLQTYDEPSFGSSGSLEKKVDGITSDLMKFSQLSHYPQSLLHFPVFGCNSDYMRALYLVLSKQITVIQSLIKERKMILMKDLKEVCDEVQSPPNRSNYPVLHSYEYCSPSLLKDFVSPAKSPTDAFLSPKFRLETTRQAKQGLEFIKDNLISKLDFEDSDMNITNSYDELSQTIEELLRDDEKEDARSRQIFLKKLKKKYFLALKVETYTKKVLKSKQKEFIRKFLYAWNDMARVLKRKRVSKSTALQMKNGKILGKAFFGFKVLLSQTKSTEISDYFYTRGLKAKVLRGLRTIIKLREKVKICSDDWYRKGLLKRSFRAIEFFLKVVVVKKKKIRQYKLKNFKSVIKKILKAWLYMVRPSAKFLKRDKKEGKSEVDRLLRKVKEKDREVVRTFRKLRRSKRSLKIN